MLFTMLFKQSAPLSSSGGLVGIFVYGALRWDSACVMRVKEYFLALNQIIAYLFKFQI